MRMCFCRYDAGGCRRRRRSILDFFLLRSGHCSADVSDVLAFTFHGICRFRGSSEDYERERESISENSAVNSFRHLENE